MLNHNLDIREQVPQLIVDRFSFDLSFIIYKLDEILIFVDFNKHLKRFAIFNPSELYKQFEKLRLNLDGIRNLLFTTTHRLESSFEFIKIKYFQNLTNGT